MNTADLQKLIQVAVAGAKETFRDFGKHDPHWIIEYADGSIDNYVTPWTSPATRLACIAYMRERIQNNAVRYVVVSEAWIAAYEKGQMKGSPGYVQPMDRPDRTEVLSMMAVEKNGPKIHIMYDIVRTKKGKPRLGKHHVDKLTGGDVTDLFNTPPSTTDDVVVD